MGYNAFVRCNCYKEGKLSSRPPFEKFVIENIEGVWLDLEWENNQEKHAQFDAWKYGNPCEHEELEICSERVANSSGMAAFRVILEELGSENYPILSEHLPQSNDGHLPVECTEGFKKELEKLNQETSDEKLIVLHELTTNQRIQSVNSNYENPFLFVGTKLTYKISVNGFFITRKRKMLWKEVGMVEFRSKNFVQEEIAENKYLLTDLLTQHTYESEISLHPDNNLANKHFEFEIKKIDASIADEYAYIIEPLLKLAEASLLTGNPIVWT